MPVILPQASLEPWLSDELDVAEILQSFLRPYDCQADEGRAGVLAFE